MQKIRNFISGLCKSPIAHLVVGFLFYSFACCVGYEYLSDGVCLYSMILGIFGFYGLNLIFDGLGLLFDRLRKKGA